MAYRKVFVLTCLMSALCLPAHAAPELFKAGDPGGGASIASAFSADGSTVVGYGYDSSMALQPYRWTSAGTETLPFSIFSYTPKFINADGSVIVGGAANGESFRWTSSGGIQALGNLGQAGNVINAMNAAGTVITGYVTDNSLYSEAYRWTDTGGIVSLGTLGGVTSYATAMNADGSVIVGTSDNGTYNEAFRWTSSGGMVGLGALFIDPFISNSSAAVVSADGNVIAGSSYNGTHGEAFRWTSGTGMQGIGAGWTQGSFTDLINADGSVIVGRRNDGVGTEAFRWTDAGGMVGLGKLGRDNSVIHGMTPDGSVMTGFVYAGLSDEAVRWKSDTGLQTLRDILTNAGVDLTGWNSFAVDHMYISNDGQRIVGTGDFNGLPHAYIFTENGLITPDELEESVTPAVAELSQQVQSSMVDGVSQSLFVARNALSSYFPRTTVNSQGMSSQELNDAVTPAAGGPRLLGEKRKAVYALGNFGIGQENNFSNHNTSGTTGMLVEVMDSLAIGAGIIGSTNHQETHRGGRNNTDTVGANIVAAYEPPSGLRLYGAAAAASLNVDTRRHYLNGAGLDGSKGSTDGMGYGLALRGGYEFGIASKTSLMPYAEMQASRTSLNGYTETGGGFPLTVDAQNHNLLVSRLGAEVSHDLNQRFTLRGRTAWAHRYTDDGSVSATIIGITQAMPGYSGDRDWAELGTTLNYSVSDRTSVSFDLSGRAGETADPALSATAGIVMRF